jgi:hypothetical protein
MGSGDPPGLQNRRAAGLPVAGVFDSHTLPPFPFSGIEGTAEGSHVEIVLRNAAAVMKT